MGKPGVSKIVCLVFVACIATGIAAPGQTFNTLAVFRGTNGANPLGSLIQGTDGDSYGTTSDGGTSNTCTHNCGTVFNNDPRKGTLIKRCTASAALTAQQPSAGLVQASHGNFYGTTAHGGAICCGTIFQMTPGFTLTAVNSFRQH